jgi:type III pantothenate kinase
MILCDVGNSNVDIYHDGKIWAISVDEFDDYNPKEKVYFISVNDKISNILKDKKNYINIEKYFVLDSIYQGMGIDRIAACYGIKDGIIVDAGSAITIDIMSNSMHLGGYILPGISAYEKCYANISPRLAQRVNPNVVLDALPQKTEDAISYGIIKSILMMLESTCRDKTIYFTGGDGKFFSKFFKNSIYDRAIIFRSMLKIIDAANLEG